MDPDDRRYSPEIVRNYSLRSRNVMRKGSHYKTKTKRPIITTSLSEENAILISSGQKKIQEELSISEPKSTGTMKSPVKKLSVYNTPSNSPSILLNDSITLCFKDRIPMSLAGLCLQVLNSTETLFIRTKSTCLTANISETPSTSSMLLNEEPQLTFMKNQAKSTVCGNIVINEDSDISVDSFQEELEYYTGKTVTLLKDSGNQPSLNTMINQELEDEIALPNNTTFLDDLRTTGSPPHFINSPVNNLPCSSGLDPLLSSLLPDEMNTEIVSSCSEDGDYSPDDGDADYVPDEVMRHSSHEFVHLEIEDNAPDRTRKRAKRGRADKENWLNEKNKIKRMKGESYEGRRKTDDGKIVFDITKRERSSKFRCSHTESSKYYKCFKVTEHNREQNFNQFWKLSWEGKRVWVKQTVRCQSVSRRKCSTVDARRHYTYKYTLETSEGLVPVCKKMYLNTLDVGEWSVQNWSKGEVHATHSTKRNSTIKDRENESRKYVQEYLNLLPKLESHYCRKSTTKLYLEPKWNSKQSVYREYLDYLISKGKEEFKMSNYIFWEEFEALNLSLFSPKKDECDTCCANRIGNLSHEAYTAHILRKDMARQEKSTDKNLKDPTIKVFTFDLQAVLLSPALNASALYYKTKLKVHNFTIFDLNTSEGFCFIWNECQGGVTADEFASILYYFLNNHITGNVNEVIFWSDGCTNQNRNAILANALLFAAVQKSITITHKYLEKGHTQMECDSMHSTIERKLKNREIYSPAQYVEICKTARLTKPYHVQYLQHTFFTKFSSMPYLRSIRPGNKTGDATVFDLRCIQYRTDGTIFYKKVQNEDFVKLPKKIKMPGKTDTLPLLYSSSIPIPKSKYVHLQELKAVLPIDVHPFYDQLPHQCSEQRRSGNTCSCRRTVLPD